MEAILEALCDLHGLTAIAVTKHRGSHTTVFVHSSYHCEMGSGDTFDQVLASALANLAEKIEREAT